MSELFVIPEDAKPYIVQQKYEQYTTVEQDTWKYLYDRRMQQLREHACQEYLEGISALGLTDEKMPVVERLNAVLQKRTRWMLLPVSGFLPGRAFFDLLAARVFPTTTYIRKSDSLEYTPEPDIFHDVFGHVPMHAHLVFADYLQAFADIARRVDNDADQERLGRLFWYTVEFGLIRQNGKLKLYGSGIISSHKEASNVIDGGCRILDFDLDRVLHTAVKVDELQPALFAIDSFQQISEATREVRRVFKV
jgi:phenylalanine-4-hydroxylase